MILLLCLGALLAFVLYVFFVEPLWVVPLLERLTPQVTYRVPTDLPLVALSFDDGPHPVYTPQVLEILQRHGARATFFLIGDRALRHPEIVAQIKTSGNEVGNHYFYTRMGTMMSHSDEEFLRNLGRVEKAIGLGDGPKVFRAPGGIARPRQLALARGRGYTCALGCAYPHDPARPPLWYIRWLVTKNLKPGTIIILHDGIKNPTRAIEALPHILREGETRGLRFVSIGELISAGSSCLDTHGGVGETLKAEAGTVASICGRRYSLSMLKQALRGVFMILGLAAVVVAFVVPFGLGGGLVFAGAIFVGVCCLLAWSKLDEDGDIPPVWPSGRNLK